MPALYWPSSSGRQKKRWWFEAPVSLLTISFLCMFLNAAPLSRHGRSPLLCSLPGSRRSSCSIVSARTFFFCEFGLADCFHIFVLISGVEMSVRKRRGKFSHAYLEVDICCVNRWGLIDGLINKFHKVIFALSFRAKRLGLLTFFSSFSSTSSFWTSLSAAWRTSASCAFI